MFMKLLASINIHDQSAHFGTCNQYKLLYVSNKGRGGARFGLGLEIGLRVRARARYWHLLTAKFQEDLHRRPTKKVVHIIVASGNSCLQLGSVYSIIQSLLDILSIHHLQYLINHSATAGNTINPSLAVSYQSFSHCWQYNQSITCSILSIIQPLLAIQSIHHLQYLINHSASAGNTINPSLAVSYQSFSLCWQYNQSITCSILSIIQPLLAIQSIHHLQYLINHSASAGNTINPSLAVSYQSFSLCWQYNQSITCSILSIIQPLLAIQSIHHLQYLINHSASAGNTINPSLAVSYQSFSLCWQYNQSITCSILSIIQPLLVSGHTKLFFTSSYKNTAPNKTLLHLIL